jgi:hypothetical protein
MKLKPVIPKEQYDRYGKNLANLLGERAEDRVKAILHSFMEKGLIEDYLHAKKNSELDHMKIDFVVAGKFDIFLIQVKSSRRSISARKRNALKEDNISLVIGNTEDRRLIKSLYKIVA